MVLIGVYNVFNMYCDIRWRITKNLWHLLFMLIFLGMVIWQAPSSVGWILLGGCFAFLFGGLLLERVGSTAPGDTKMMMANGVGLSSYILLVKGEFVLADFRNAMFLYAGSLVLLLFLIDAYRFARKYGVKRVFVTLFSGSVGFILSRLGLAAFAPVTQLDGKDLRVLPGAVMIAMSVGLTLYLFFPMKF